MFNQLNDEQIVILNKIAYGNLPDQWTEDSTLYDLVVEMNDKRLLKAIDKYPELQKLRVIDYENNNKKSGFCAIALQDPDTGAVGMSFRGTEGMNDLLHNPKDMADNTLTASIGVSQQSIEAIEFFERNEDKNGKNYLFGHSKGE